jgi:hypothetical protein
VGVYFLSICRSQDGRRQSQVRARPARRHWNSHRRQPGDSSILDTVVRAIDESALFVVLGTRTYGRKTASLSATRQEMVYALESRKPLFVVKMCDEYEEHVTRFLLDSSIPYYDLSDFGPDKDIPEELVDQVVAAAWAAFERGKAELKYV